MTQTVAATAALGSAKTGLAIGYRVLNVSGTTYSAFSTTGVAETSVAGTYRVANGVAAPDAGGYIVFGTSGVDLAEATIDGVVEVAAIKAKTDNLPSDPADQSAVEAAITAATSPLATAAAVADLPTNAELASALAAADDAVLAAITALNNLSAAQVNAEVVDALAADTYAEPGQGTPGATTSLAAKINYLYKAWRNRKTQTATTFILYADNTTTADQKATMADDGTTFSQTEMTTGA